MRKFISTAACAALVGLATLIATPVEGKDTSAKDKAAKAAKDKAAKDKAAKDKAAKDKAAKDKAAKDKAAKDKAAKDKAEKEKHAKELAAKEKHAKELAAKEKHAKELAAKEKHAKELAAKEKGTKTTQKGSGTTVKGSGAVVKGSGTTKKGAGEHAAIYEALRLLHEANHNAKSAPKTFNRFGGHRNKAVDQMGRGIWQLEHALKHVKAPLPAKLTNIETSDRPMHHALKRAAEALESANAAPHKDNIYGGHRNAAVDHLKHVIKQLEEGITYYETHPTK